MKALTGGIGLVALVLGGLEPGREIMYSVATFILGGSSPRRFASSWSTLDSSGLSAAKTASKLPRLKQSDENLDNWLKSMNSIQQISASACRLTHNHPDHFS
jgi:hypothetical protein